MSFKPRQLYIHYCDNNLFKNILAKYNKETWLPIHEAKTANLFYHYTSINALSGMLSTGSLWLTHSDSTNDPQETIYARNLLDYVRSKLINNYIDSNDKISDKIKHNIIILLDNVLRINDNHPRITHQLFLSSFCEFPDKLTMWRQYAKNKSDLCLGFDFNDSTRFTHCAEGIHGNLTDEEIFFRKVLYNRQEQINLLIAYLDELIEFVIRNEYLFEATEEGFESYNLLSSAHCAHDLVKDMISCFKSDVFADESEWRMYRLIVPEIFVGKIEFRKCKNYLVPYLDTKVFNLKDSAQEFPLKRVILNPKSDSRRSKAAIEMYIQKGFVDTAKPAKDFLISTDISVCDSEYKL